jgi:hypothetical protein
MTHRQLVLTAALCTLGWTGAALAADEAPKGKQADGLDVTMRIIEDPDALGAEGITRRIALPFPADENGNRVLPPGGPVNGLEVSEEAREFGREFGEEVSDRARDLGEQASEQREEFGRSRAEELRPELPEPPEIDPPVPPRP